MPGVAESSKTFFGAWRTTFRIGSKNFSAGRMVRPIPTQSKLVVSFQMAMERSGPTCRNSGRFGTDVKARNHHPALHPGFCLIARSIGAEEASQPLDALAPGRKPAVALARARRREWQVCQGNAPRHKVTTASN